ncbi:MAG TPA: phosphatase [Ruminococcaceae bacterium]|nr:phosphatase [Oscillospiraceae bacterium]
MKKLHNYLSTHKYFYLLLLFIPLQMWFQYNELTIVPKYFTQTLLDQRIPFIKEFTIPYVIWFLFVPFGVVYIGAYSKKDFYKLFIFLFGGMATANAIFVLFPNAQGLRPSIHASDPLSSLIKFMYSVDPPINVCPSIHVINTFAINSALQHSKEFKKSRIRKVSSNILTVLICLSTVFIKQHSVFDVLCGIVVASCFYIPLYVQPVRKFVRVRSIYHAKRKAINHEER